MLLSLSSLDPAANNFAEFQAAIYRMFFIWFQHEVDLVDVYCRSLSSKVVSQYSDLLSPMAVDAVLRVLDPARPDM